MSDKEPAILGTEIVQGEVLLVNFSDNTTAILYLNDLLQLSPIRYQIELDESGKHIFKRVTLLQ